MKRLILAILLTGCGSDAPPKSDPNSEPDVDMGVGADVEVLTEADCLGLNVLHEGQCIVPGHRVDVRLTAIENLTESIGVPYVCSDVVVDETDPESFVTINRLLERTDDCIITERLPEEERTAWPYEPNPDGWTSATVRQGREEWLLETPHRDFDGCLTTYAGPPLDFGGRYEVDAPTGNADASAFPATITIPTDPEPDCPIVVSGEPLEFTWTPSGASNVNVRAQIEDIEISCDVEDTGSYTIPAELTSMLPETGSQVVGVSPRNVERSYNPDTDTLTTFVGHAWNACEFVFRD